MKRLLLSVLLAFSAIVTMQAARAWTEPFTVTQPDGSQLTLACYGDEHLHWFSTSDGIMVVAQDNTYYVAQIADGGHLTASALLAHEPALRSTAEQQLCARQQALRESFFQQADQRLQAARRAQVTGASFFPHVGQPKSLVILVNFSDVQFTSTNPVAQFTQYMCGETQEALGQNEQKNLVSVQKYFSQSSHGKFVPQFDIVGPVTLPQTMEYYGADASATSYDKNFSQFCTDVIAAVDALGTVNMSDYDNNNDGEAELVCVVYAGYGQSNNTNLVNTIWPKCSYRGISSSSGTRIGYMNCNAELRKSTAELPTEINGIGVFVHEFSHGMGLPDMYPNTIAGRACDNQSMEFFDLMDYGEYANNGYAPVPYTAWEQEAMDWIDVEVLSETQLGLQLSPVIDGGKAYKFGNGANDEEWIYIENVQPRDNTNKVSGFAYGRGLLAYHVAYSNHTVSMGDYPNNEASKPRMAVVPADGLLVSGYRFVTSGNPTDAKPYTQQQYLESMRCATFPGKKEVSQLTDAQALPNYTFYNYPQGGTAQTGYNLTDIVEDTDTRTVTLNFWKGEPTAIQSMHSALPANTSTDAAYYTLDGRRLIGEPQHSGLYIHHGKIYRK